MFCPRKVLPISSSLFYFLLSRSYGFHAFSFTSSSVCLWQAFLALCNICGQSSTCQKTIWYEGRLVGQLFVNQMTGSQMHRQNLRFTKCLSSKSLLAKCLLAKCLLAKCLLAKCLLAKCLSAKCMSVKWVLTMKPIEWHTKETFLTSKGRKLFRDTNTLAFLSRLQVREIKSLKTLTPGANVIKRFKYVSYDFSK